MSFPGPSVGKGPRIQSTEDRPHLVTFRNRSLTFRPLSFHKQEEEEGTDSVADTVVYEED